MTTPASRIFLTGNPQQQALLQGVELASFRARAVALPIDGAIAGALAVVPGLWSSFATRAPARAVTLMLDTGALWTLVVLIGYFTLATFIGEGATGGKNLPGIRVVSLVHSHLSLWHCVERTLGYAASSLEAGFGFLQYFTHPNRRTVHDRIAETIVIFHRGSMAKRRTR